MQPPLLDAPDAIVLPPINGEVTFKDVHFSYDRSQPVLQGLSLTVKPGSVIALVGSSGAGKTTLINLLLRLYEPDQGSITIDGYDLRSVNRKIVISPMVDSFAFPVAERLGIEVYSYADQVET